MDDLDPRLTARLRARSGKPEWPLYRLGERPRDAGGALTEVAKLLLAAGAAPQPPTMAAWLADAAVEVWLALDQHARHGWWRTVWWHERMITGLLAGDLDPLNLVLAAGHSDGYIREAAVIRLAPVAHKVASPVLALRAADRVPQVRDRARQECQRRLRDDPAAALRAAAPVAFALANRERGAWLDRVLRDLLRDGPPSVFTAAIGAPDGRTRRVATMLGVDRLDLAKLMRAAKTDPDLPTRVLCADTALRIARATGDTTVPRSLLTGGAAPVRAEAVRALADAGDLAPAVAALPDRSGIVRASAQAALRRAGADPSPHYRALVGQWPVSPGAIAGFGETGGDPDLLPPLLAHPLPRGRAEAVRALRARGVTPVPLLWPLLTDPSPPVTRQVVASLSGQPLDRTALQRLMDHPAPHVRTAAYHLFRAGGAWTRLATTLHLLGDPDPSLRGRARADLHTWLDREAATAYSRPTEAQVAELSALVPAAAPVIGPARLRTLRFHCGLPAES
ncbi:hypothetical protein [Actinokineospora iranica]|uniref:HEAT repeat-containing protein n=1 Tax=Actinokineospora iranica TaxID=1271860 RepID=A0A1G6WMR8_9PSEU|nr:hypothetical protein [Actinokineospora iranica]SDD67079.1 hypothetical protein SAMN05216174_11586 [Actinokineospora iranica]